MIFDYVSNVADNNPRVCIYDVFKSLIDSPHVADLIERYRTGDTDAKKQLPAFLFHATFGGKKRLAKNAQASGLVMVDFDHVTDADMERFKETLASEEMLEWNIVFAHITPSGKGLRLVLIAEALPVYEGCTTISDFQHRIARLMGAEQYLDEVTTDLSRLSFVPKKADVLLLDQRLFVEEKKMDFPTSAPARSNSEQQTTAVFTTGESQETYQGVRLSDIFRMYFELSGGVPTEGNRNAAFYSAARDLRYICDFNPKVIARMMPEVGLTEKEVLDVCTSACSSTRAKDVPQLVRSIVQSLSDVPDDESDDTPAQTASAKLPPIFDNVASCFPATFREAVVLAMLPCLGTLATRTRARYLDGEIHSPSFFTVVSAEQASGKSFARRIVNLLMEDLRIEDESARVVEQAYRQSLKQHKNRKDQPEDPRVVIRCVPANISVAKLLQRLDYAEGRHLFSFAEEMDTVIKANSGGTWSQKSDIYRNAFDNAEYGQDYMSESSYSANLRIFYNLLILGTPRQTNKFFADVENGLVSRCMFASLPDGFGQKMPVFKEISPEAFIYTKKFIDNLRACDGELNLAPVNEALSQWLEEQRLLALKEADRARDIFRKRSAVIGFRAAMVLMAGYGKRGTRKKTLQDFALYVASLVLREQLKYAGARLESALDDNSAEVTTRQSKRVELFKELGDNFTYVDLTTLMAKWGLKQDARKLIYVWRSNNLIEKIDRNNFKKI